MVSQTAEYALQAVVFLAMREKASSAQQISAAVRIPVGYLRRTLRRLVQADVLTARRGVGGDLALARAPSDISVLDILKASDSGISRIESCPRGIQGHTSLCPRHRLIDTQLANVTSVFARTSISDLSDSEGGLRAICDDADRLPARVQEHESLGALPSSGDTDRK